MIDIYQNFRQNVSQKFTPDTIVLYYLKMDWPIEFKKSCPESGDMKVSSKI